MIIKSKRVYISGSFIPAGIEITDGKVSMVLDYDRAEADRDYENLMIIPGMIDIHCHGGFGYDVTHDADEEGLRRWAKGLLTEGITSFCPTTMTQSGEVLLTALENVARVKEGGCDGAEILGIHLEGPFLNKKNKGAQSERHILIPDVEQFKEYQKAAKGLIKIVTVACEEDDDFALTRYASANGVKVSVGHSASGYGEAMLAVANGACGITHTYNGMNGMHHREPALVGAAMCAKDVFCEIICDGNHVKWPAVRSLIESKGPHHCILIDDALCAKGCETGKYHLGGCVVEIRSDGSAYIEGTDTLAGGTARFGDAMRNLVRNALIPIDWAINMATVNPAKYLGIDDRKGRIAFNCDADLVVIDDDFNVKEVYRQGKEVK